MSTHADVSPNYKDYNKKKYMKEKTRGKSIMLMCLFMQRAKSKKNKMRFFKKF